MELRQEVALKVLHPERVTPTAVERLRREAAIARTSSSPHLLRVFDIHNDEGVIYLAMELVDGETLRSRLSRGRLSVGTAERLATELLRGLAELHSLGIVHRDIKPSNILLNRDGTAKVGDFGLARRLTGDLTRITEGHNVVGTLDYLSPEQALGQPVTPRSDLYSLGIVLYEALTGQLPHPASSPLGTLLKRFRVPPAPVRRLRGDVPRRLARVVHRMLERKPVHRYDSARTALAELVGSASPRSRIAEVFRRHRWLLGAAILLASVAVGGVVLLSDRGSFDRLVTLEHGGVAAVDSRGEVLWEVADGGPWLHGLVAPVRLSRGGEALLAAMVHPPRTFPTPRRLSLLDPDSGHPVRLRSPLRLVSGAGHRRGRPQRRRTRGSRGLHGFGS
jgi:hypothetical protein